MESMFVQFCLWIRRILEYRDYRDFIGQAWRYIAAVREYVVAWKSWTSKNCGWLEFRLSNRLDQVTCWVPFSRGWHAHASDIVCAAAAQQDNCTDGARVRKILCAWLSRKKKEKRRWVCAQEEEEIVSVRAVEGEACVKVACFTFACVLFDRFARRVADRRVYRPKEPDSDLATCPVPSCYVNGILRGTIRAFFVLPLTEKLCRTLLLKSLSIQTKTLNEHLLSSFKSIVWRCFLVHLYLNLVIYKSLRLQSIRKIFLKYFFIFGQQTSQINIFPLQ